MTKTESSLSPARPDLKDLVELIPGMVVMYNINTGAYVYVNKAVRKILGYSPQEFINGGIEFVIGLVHPDDLPVILQKNEQALKLANSSKAKAKDRQPIVEFEYRMKHKKGHWVWLHTDGTVYDRDSRGKIEHVLNLSIDITSSKEVEERLQQRAEDLIDINASKDEFVAIASHQLRTPATAVKQYIGLLLEGYTEPLTEEQREFLQKAYDNNDRQLQIVGDLLIVAQLDLDKMKLRLRRHNITKIIKESAVGLNDIFKRRKQSVVISTPDDAVMGKVDGAQFRTVIDNLLENATNYSPDETKIAITLKKTANRILITIKDEGVGIAEVDFPRLFQKFSRVSNQFSPIINGTGLGLYLSQKIIKLHGGEITVQSSLGKGASFIIELPA